MGMKLSTFDMDRRMRTMGMRFLGEAGEAMLAETNPDVLAQIQAFCDGINAFIEQNRNHLPIEFQVLYDKPEPFRPADVIGLSRFYASNLTANLAAVLGDYQFHTLAELRQVCNACGVVGNKLGNDSRPGGQVKDLLTMLPAKGIKIEQVGDRVRVIK